MKTLKENTNNNEVKNKDKPGENNINKNDHNNFSFHSQYMTFKMYNLYKLPALNMKMPIDCAEKFNVKKC